MLRRDLLPAIRALHDGRPYVPAINTITWNGPFASIQAGLRGVGCIWRGIRAAW